MSQQVEKWGKESSVSEFVCSVKRQSFGWDSRRSIIKGNIVNIPSHSPPKKLIKAILMCRTTMDWGWLQVSSLVCQAKWEKNTCGHNVPQTNRQVLGLSQSPRSTGVVGKMIHQYKKNILRSLQMLFRDLAPSGSVSKYFLFLFTVWGLSHKSGRRRFMVKVTIWGFPTMEALSACTWL